MLVLFHGLVISFDALLFNFICSALFTGHLVRIIGVQDTAMAKKQSLTSRCLRTGKGRHSISNYVRVSFFNVEDTGTLADCRKQTKCVRSSNDVETRETVTAVWAALVLGIPSILQ